jgi:hypothetical protein
MSPSPHLKMETDPDGETLLSSSSEFQTMDNAKKTKSV